MSLSKAGPGPLVLKLGLIWRVTLGFILGNLDLNRVLSSNSRVEAGSVSFHASSCAFWSAKKSVELREGSLSKFDLFNAAFSRAGTWLLFSIKI